MRRILSLLGAAVTFAACSSPTAPASADKSVEAAKAKAALAAATKNASTGRNDGKLSAN